MAATAPAPAWTTGRPTGDRPEAPKPRYGARPTLTTKEAFERRDDYDPDAPKNPWRREEPLTDADGMDITQVIEAVYGNPDLYRLAAGIPDRPKTKPGRPADYPNWAMAGSGALVSAYGSARGTHLAMRVNHNWDIVLRTVAAARGEQAVTELRQKARTGGPNRNHWNYWSKVNKRHAHPIGEAYVPLAVDQAVEQGLLDPDVPVSYACPDPRNTLYGDGKVMKSPIRRRKGVKFDQATGKYLTAGGTALRRDPGSSLWNEGGDDGKDAYGSKFVYTAVRGPGHFNRVVLAMHRQDKNGPGEMDIGMHQIREVARHAGQGVRAVIWDGAMSGVHIDELMRDLGLVVVSPTIAKSNPDGHRAGRKSETRVEKEREHETLRFRSDKGPCKHALRMNGGRRCEMVTDGLGHDHLVPVKIDKVTRVGNAGAYRWYHELTVACPTNDREPGDGTGRHDYRLPLVQSRDDTAAGLNRSEYVRQLPPDTKGYARTYGRRPPAESDNSRREMRYAFWRIPAYGAEQQSLVMVLGNLLDNSKSRWLHKRRKAAGENTDAQAA